MQKYDFHFIIQLSKWIFRGFRTATPEKALKLADALQTDKPLKFTYEKEGTGEIREAVGKEFRKNKFGNIIYHDLEKNALRSFKPQNLKGDLIIA